MPILEHAIFDLEKYTVALNRLLEGRTKNCPEDLSAPIAAKSALKGFRGGKL